MDEPGTIWFPSHNYFPGRTSHRPRWIIIHGTAGFNSAQEVGRYFQTADVATHYTIGRDGTIVQSVSEEDSAWGNGGITEGHDPWWSRSLNPNYVTISIEHVKPHRDNSDELTEAQQAASFQLVRHICARHQIPPGPADASGGITGHRSMNPVNRSFCPGPYPWDALFTYLTQTTTHNNR
jgi:N-acetyl-anhydromuramyl-L-alanine amidase AmpD